MINLTALKELVGLIEYLLGDRASISLDGHTIDLVHI